MKFLYDTDFLVNFFVETDSNHTIALKLQKKIEEAREEIFVLNLVSYELATVLSRKLEHSIAVSTVKIFKSKKLSTIYLLPEEEEIVWQEFFSYTKKNISFVDCANLVMAKKHKFKIVSFDNFYPKDILVV